MAGKNKVQEVQEVQEVDKTAFNLKETENVYATFLGIDDKINPVDLKKSDGEIISVNRYTSNITVKEDKATGKCEVKTINAVGETAKMLGVLEVAKQAGEALSLMQCVALNYLNEYGVDKVGFKSFNEMCSHYGIGAETGKQYARIGKHFLDYDEESGKVSYKSLLMVGASVSNMNQILTLLGEDGDISDIESHIADGTLSPCGRLATVKDEIHDIKEANGTLKKSNRKGKKTEDPKPAVAILAKWVSEISDDDDRKTDLLKAINLFEQAMTD